MLPEPEIVPFEAMQAARGRAGEGPDGYAAMAGPESRKVMIRP